MPFQFYMNKTNVKCLAKHNKVVLHGRNMTEIKGRVFIKDFAKMERNSKQENTSPLQYQTMVDFMKRNPILVQSAKKSWATQKICDQLWEKLAEQLNMNGPPTHNLVKWKKVWYYFKGHTKRKARKNASQMLGKGDGPEKIIPLTSTEKQLFTLIEKECSTLSKATSVPIKTFLTAMNVDTSPISNDTDSSVPQHIDFKSVCRTCMLEIEFMAPEERQRQYKYIFDIVAECGGLKIIELLRSTTPQLILQMDNDLPQKMCEKCFENLVSVYKFQQMCLKSDKKIQELTQRNGMKNYMGITHDLIDTNATITTAEFAVIEEKPVPDPLQFNDNDSHKAISVPLEIHTGFKSEHNDDDDCEEFIDEPMTESVQICIDPVAATEDIVPSLPEINTVAEDQNSETSWDDIPLQNLIIKQKKLKSPTVKAKRRNTKLRKSSKVCTAEDTNSTSALPGQSDISSIKVKPLGFACKVCLEVFETRSNLIKHKRSHREKKLYVCKHCNKNFQQSSTLKDHLRLHTGEQPYLCSQCGKSFHSYDNFAQHLLRHAGVKKFECPVCPKKFTTWAGLCSHKVIHRKEKQHICDQCGAAFHFAYSLKKHKFYHTGEKPYKCDYCDKNFARAVNMRRHRLIHTGEKPYKCKYCERAFSQSNECIQHMRIHLGDNVYRCELCPNGFPKAAELRKHIELHKNEDEETRKRNLEALMEDEKRLRLKYKTEA